MGFAQQKTKKTKKTKQKLVKNCLNRVYDMITSVWQRGSENSGMTPDEETAEL